MISLRTLLASLALTLASIAAPAAAADARTSTGAVELFLNAETAGLPGRVEVRVGAPDPRAQPAPCTLLEPFLPAGSRLWGRTTLGVRCRDAVPGAVGWSMLLPVEIKVFGNALLTTRALAAGEALTPDSYAVREIELTREPRGVLTDAAQIGDAVIARPLAAGQVLRGDMVKARQVVTAGDQVKVVAAGRGFRISTQGRALNAATAGQTVRIQSETGRMLSGTAHADGTVE
jgi:flagella basal body P-ring formation protein FlgA